MLTVVAKLYIYILIVLLEGSQSVSYCVREDIEKQPEIKLKFILSFNKYSILHAARG